jgi:hypothetical protein
VSYRTQRRSRLTETGAIRPLGSLELTKDAAAWYAGARARVEAGTTLVRRSEITWCQ